MFIFVASIFKPLKMVKSGAIFDQAAKLGKASRDAYNPGLWLILKNLLKNWVAKSVASGIDDFNGYGIKDKGIVRIRT